MTQDKTILDKGRETAKLSKHLQECLDYIRTRKEKYFDDVTIFPKVKRGAWVLRKLESAGYFKYNFLCKWSEGKCNAPYTVRRILKAMDKF